MSQRKCVSIVKTAKDIADNKNLDKCIIQYFKPAK